MPTEILAIIITSSVSTITIVVSILVVFISLSKKIDALNSKFDRLDERQIATNQRIDKFEIDIKDDIKEIKTDNKAFISKAIDKIGTSIAASML